LSTSGQPEVRNTDAPVATAPTVEQNPDKLEVAPGTLHEGIEGWIPELVNEDDLRVALEKAFDYRGDVTLTLKDGARLEGYIFDRITGPSLSNSFVRLLPKDSNQRVKVCYADILALAFTGRDTAAGKSFEAWIRKYWEKKAAGEANINIQPESLD
jgi:hypothetical protein